MHNEQTLEPSLPWLPLLVGSVTLVGWDGHSYVDDTGRTYWSGATEPTAEDATSVVMDPRTPPAAPLRQSARVVLARMTTQERAALRACTVPAIQDAYDIALIEGVISEADADFPAFRSALDQLGIIATARWATLLAP